MAVVGLFLVGASTGATLESIRFKGLVHEIVAGQNALARNLLSVMRWRISSALEAEPELSLLRYAGAFPLVGFATILVLNIPSLRNYVPFALFYVAIALTARWQGLGPALFAIAISSIDIDYFVLAPRLGWAKSNEDIFRLFSFVFTSAIISGMIASRGRSIVSSEPDGKSSHSFSITRRHPRFTLDVEMTIRSRREGLIPAKSMDISEAGISAVLPVHLPVGEGVELELKLPLGVIKSKAAVRQRSAYRYGFEFVDLDSAALHKIRESCCILSRIDMPLPVCPAAGTLR